MSAGSLLLLTWLPTDSKGYTLNYPHSKGNNLVPRKEVGQHIQGTWVLPLLAEAQSTTRLRRIRVEWVSAFNGQSCVAKAIYTRDHCGCSPASSHDVPCVPPECGRHANAGPPAPPHAASRFPIWAQSRIWAPSMCGRLLSVPVPLCRVAGNSAAVQDEVERVESAGGWVADGRVCDIIAVSRAFGDRQFKRQDGREAMLQLGIECAASSFPRLLHHTIAVHDAGDHRCGALTCTGGCT